MSADLRYDREKNILHIVLHGSVTLDEFADVLETITHTEEYPPDVPAIWDLSALDTSDLDISMIELLNDIRKRFPERGLTKLAIVASSELTFGLSRMYEAFSADLPQMLRVFKDTGSAELWLQEADAS